MKSPFRNTWGIPFPATIDFQWPSDPAGVVVGRFPLTAPPAVYGDNHLGMRLVESAAEAREDVTLYEIEVLVPRP